MIPVYLSKSKDSMDLDFELARNAQLIDPRENQKIILTEPPKAPEFFFTTPAPTAPVITVPAVLPEFHVIEQHPIDNFPISPPNLPAPSLKTKLSSSNQNNLSENFLNFNKNNRLKLKKHLMEAF